MEARLGAAVLQIGHMYLACPTAPPRRSCRPALPPPLLVVASLTLFLISAAANRQSAAYMQQATSAADGMHSVSQHPAGCMAGGGAMSRTSNRVVNPTGSYLCAWLALPCPLLLDCCWCWCAAGGGGCCCTTDVHCSCLNVYRCTTETFRWYLKGWESRWWR